MNTMLAIIVIMIAVGGVATGTLTTITTIDIFAQNATSHFNQLINDCMINNVTACNALENYNSTVYPQSG
ncbi:hypothetical protein [Candidatus Nitrosocosmicus arcticus]|uniref:Uncharacterized protein n=1 Tax=Candidatus Nitrosocosmicus arcticus TaxID=2035267 RepID=A0A557SZ29_9ARCH|nr:hypothetical protein [Candidatus Nitrosocosmicus arcticus]TVP41861.1 hypothetical protein NARC_10267 [Candidatus Nitrosocosmicus arcticus]